MKILTVNTGSSSIKYTLYNMDKFELICSGLIEKIGFDKSEIKHVVFNNAQERKVNYSLSIADHIEGLEMLAKLLIDNDFGVVDSHNEIEAVGHRVVHGGEDFKDSQIITEAIIKSIDKNCPLAPLHNPENLNGIKIGQKIFSNAKHVAVFDTAFHQTIPEHAYMYALPYELYDLYKIRKYGFHGTSHKYVCNEAAVQLGKPLSNCNLISIHLGNGSSMAAIKQGECIDTTMGMTPLAGLIMGTRCGDLDPAVIFHLSKNGDYTLEQIDALLNKQSGLKGVCTYSDMREIDSEIKKGNKQAILAMDMLIYQIKKFIGSYAAVLGSLDAIIFTAGIGENNPDIRKDACENLELFGISVDEHKNNTVKERDTYDIHSSDSTVSLFVIPTNEELQIVRETYEVLTTS